MNQSDLLYLTLKFIICFIRCLTGKRQNKITEDQPSYLPNQNLTCQDCMTDLTHSFLLEKFQEPVCDNCYQLSKEEKYSMITKTDALKDFMLHENDLESRIRPEYSLPFILKPNNKYSRFGTLKLFLKNHVCIFNFLHY